MTAARGWSWVGINGGFRSNLGKRVERLMRMSGGVRRPLAGWAGATAKLAATILVVPTIVLLFGSFQSAQGQKEDRLRDQLRDSWNSSPGALLVLAALDDTEKQKEDIAKRVQNGKLLYEMGKYEEAEAVLVAVMKEDHANRPGAYYLDLIKEARLWGRSHKHEPVPLPTATTTQQRRDIDARVMKGKLLYERGKLDESEAVLVSVIKDDRANRAAAYYLDLIKEARFTGRAQNLQDVSEIMITTKGRQAILSKLNNIMLDNVSFDLPLKDVLLKLRTESQKRDPDGIGIKFMINQNVEGPEPFSTGTTGTVEAAPKAEQRDIGTDVRIKISSPLHNLRLADVLDAITKVADSPIRYTIKDDAVVFSPMLLEPNPGLALYSKTFRVDSGTFAQGLKRLYGTNLSLGGSSPSEGIEMDDGPDRPADGHDDFGGPVLPGARLSFVTRTNETIQLHQMLTQYFSAAGVNLDPPKAIFFNDGLGLLLVRATLPDLDIIEQAIDMLNQTPPQVTIEARFTEVDEAALQGLALNWNTPLQEITGLKTATGHRFWVATNSQDFTGTITAAQLRSTLTAIEQRFHADVLSVAKVTVESGRQAHLGSSNGAEAETLVVIPAIGPDGYFIQITASPAIMTGPETWQVKAIRKVLDGETMVIGSEITNHSPGPKKVWVVFITPRIMDPAGNPVHTDDELSKRIGTPRQ
jgi:tetratricopeptide (TPR) repeat protein